MAKSRKTMENKEIIPQKPEGNKYEVVGVVPGIVHWGNDESETKIACRDWDLKTLTEYQMKLLFDNGFPYLKKV